MQSASLSFGFMELLVVGVVLLILFVAAMIVLSGIVKKSPGWVLWLIMLLGGGGFLVIMVLMVGAFVFWNSVAAPSITSSTNSASSSAGDWIEDVSSNGVAYEVRGGGENTPFQQPSVSAIEKRLAEKRTAASEDEDLDSFVADVYPGVVQCGAPIAYLISNAIEEILQKNDLSDARPEAEADIKAEAEELEKKTIVRIELENKNLSKQNYADVTRRFRKQMKTLMPNAAFDEDEDPIGNAEKLERFKLTFRSIETSLGKLICEISVADITRRCGVEFIPKLWLTDFSKWKQFNRDHQYIIGRCESFEPSGTDARVKAIKDAKRQMETLWPGSTKLAVRLDQHAGPPRLYEHVDSFSQKFSRPYGDVYRESVLFQLNNVSVAGQGWNSRGSDSRVGVPISGTPLSRTPITTNAEAESLVAEAAAAAAAYPNSIPNSIPKRGAPSIEWFIAVLVLATVVLGMLSNVFTQGYYRSQISASVVGFSFLGLAALIFLMMA